MNFYRFFIAVCILILIAACAARIETPVHQPAATQPSATAAPLPAPDSQVRPGQEAGSQAPIDDLDLASLETAIGRSLQYYEKVKDQYFHFGNRIIAIEELKASLLAFRTIIRSADTTEIKMNKVMDGFDFIPYNGQSDKGTVTFTGYYVPVLEGSPVRTSRYRYPIYGKPDDLVVVKPDKTDGRRTNGIIIGRLEAGEIVPYYSRSEIDRKGLLKDRRLEILWVDDPIELHSLHVQGSGKIRMPDGGIVVVSYAQSNGLPFRPISKFLLEQGLISARDIRYPQVKNYLREHPEGIDEVLSYNDRYVFFRKVDRDPIGSLQFPVTSGRTIATDPDVFPKGALAFIKTQKPMFDAKGQIKQWVPFSRFVLNQDAGTAIKGPGRVDVFCGDGPDAEQIAGSLKEKGDIYILIRKNSN
jgi:membrane-bound lytic murein transglycosylase A